LVVYRPPWQVVIEFLDVFNVFNFPALVAKTCSPIPPAPPKTVNVVPPSPVSPPPDTRYFELLPSPSPTPVPDCEECENIFPTQTFYTYAVEKLSGKFPFDIVGDIPSGAGLGCSLFTFGFPFNAVMEFCLLRDAVRIFRPIILILFSLFLLRSL
jgi:hypothetical protein